MNIAIFSGTGTAGILDIEEVQWDKLKRSL
jgi:hypothetical protein